MNIDEAYIRFLQLVNRNATNNRTNVDKPRFVLSYTDMQNRFVEWVLEKRNEDVIRDIQAILVKDKNLLVTDTKSTYTAYGLPSNYFNFANITASAKTECCQADWLTLHEVKSEDAEELRNDTNNKPSFEYRESFYYFSEGSIILYKDEFEYEKVLLTYYRYPLQVDIIGYKKADGSDSISVDPEFDDKVVVRILLAMAKEFSAVNSDATQHALDKERLFTI